MWSKMALMGCRTDQTALVKCRTAFMSGRTGLVMSLVDFMMGTTG